MSLQFLTGPRPLALLTITHSYLGVSHFLRTRVESVINRAKKTYGGNDYGKISSRFHTAWLRTLPQRGRVSISKGLRVRGEKRPRGPGGVERIDRPRLSKHAGNDHRRPIGGRFRPGQNHGVVGNMNLFLW